MIGIELSFWIGVLNVSLDTFKELMICVLLIQFQNGYTCHRSSQTGQFVTASPASVYLPPTHLTANGYNEMSGCPSVAPGYFNPPPRDNFCLSNNHYWPPVQTNARGFGNANQYATPHVTMQSNLVSEDRFWTIRVDSGWSLFQKHNQLPLQY